MRTVGRFLLPWIGAMMVSAAIAHTAEMALANPSSPETTLGCAAAPSELAFTPLPTPDRNSLDMAYVHFR